MLLIEQRKYFILHAPRQTGKTSCLLALRDLLNAQGDHCCVYANIEAGQAARNDVPAAMGAIISALYRETVQVLGDRIDFTFRDFMDSEDPLGALEGFLSVVCKLADRPVVFLIDEVDALVGNSLISVLLQLRAGYPKRPVSFPQSIILCGVRDIKDYRIHAPGQDVITGGSAFNIKAKSLSLGNFSPVEVQELYAEHTRETGQVFAPECFRLIMDYTGGQPWLVNALAHEATFEMAENRDRSVTITPAMFEQPKEQLILSRATHLDQLADKLVEDRVRRVIEPLLIGEFDNSAKDDNQYCLDLGLVRKSPTGLTIANQIYQEVIPRELTDIRQTRFTAIFQPEWIAPDGSLDTDKLFRMFQAFWRENSEIWREDMAGYEEAAPHLTFQAFLQRVANGRGFIGREFAYGSRRADLVLKWRSDAGEQRVVIELKMLTERDSYETVKAEALEQTARYADRCDATESHVVVFDRTGKAQWRNWQDKVFVEPCRHGERLISIWGM